MFISSSLDQGLAGVMAALISTSLLHPLDLIKTRFQINESSKRLSTFKTFAKIRKTDGYRSLYRGISANLAGGTLSWGLYFFFYQKLKDRSRNNDGNSLLSPSQHLIASAQAGAVTSLMTNPIWVIKTRLCASKATDANSFSGLFDGLYKTWKFEGLRGLYKGLVPGLFGVSHGAIQFMIYEELKKFKSTNSSTPEYILMAATSKMIATVSTYPYQNQIVGSGSGLYTGVIDTLTRVFKNEGITGFYKGLGTNMIRVLPGTCITFGVYELVSAKLKSWDN